MLTRTADEWEEFLQARHVPAARVRTMGEAIADPQIASARRHPSPRQRATASRARSACRSRPSPSPMAARASTRRRPTLGQHNEEILRELGLQPAAVAS